MVKKVYLPDGRYVEAPDDISEEKVLEKARERFPDAFPGPIEEGLRYIGSTALEIPKGIGLGVTQTIGGLTALPYAGARAVVPSLTPFEKTGFGEFIGETERKLSPTEEGLVPSIASGLGQFISLAGPQVLLRGAGMAGKSLFTAQAGGLGVEQQRQLVNQAKEQGVEVSPGQELSSLSVGFGIGQLERYPIERLFGGLSKNLDEGLQLSIVDRISRAAKTGGVEGMQEVASSILQESVAKGIYNPDQEVGGSMLDEFQTGAGVGAIAQGGIDYLFGNRFRRAKEFNEKQKSDAITQEETDRRRDEELQKKAEEVNRRVAEEDAKLDETRLLTLDKETVLDQVVDEQKANPSQNFLTNVTEEELIRFTGKQDYLKEMNRIRRSEGRPALKGSFSIEDIADTGVYPAEIDRLVAGKLKQSDPDMDLDMEVSIGDIETSADLRNIPLTGDNFTNFLKRTVGNDKLEDLSGVQRLAVFNAIEASDGDIGVPNSTNATVFNDRQYKKALLGIKLDTKDDLTIKERGAIDAVKKATGLTKDSDAKTLLKTASKRGDIDEFRTEFVEVDYGTPEKPSKVRYKTRAEAEAKRLESKNPNAPIRERTEVNYGFKDAPAKNFPDGSTITKALFTTKGQKDRGFRLFAGDKLVDKTLYRDEKQAKTEQQQLNDRRKAQAKRLSSNIEKKESETEKRERAFLREKKSPETNVTEFNKRYNKFLSEKKQTERKLAQDKEKLESLKKDVSLRSTGKEAVTKEGFLVKDSRGRQLGKFNSRKEAEASLLSKYDNNKLTDFTKNKSFTPGFRRVAQQELDRRTGVAREPEVSIPLVTESEKKLIQEERDRLANFKSEFRDNFEKLDKSLKENLNKIGLGNVHLMMSESIRADGADINGSYTNGIIRLAIRNRKPEDVIRTLRHEGIHALRGLNAIKESEWAVLSKRADQEWINKYLDRVKANKEGDSLRKVYEDMYRSQGLNDQQIKERIQEEAVAEAFADYTPKTPESRPDTPPPSGFIKRILFRLKKFFEAIQKSLREVGVKKEKDVFTQSDQIFNKIESGEYNPNNPFKATKKDIRQADRFYKNYGIYPYLSEGPVKVEVEPAQFAIKIPKETDDVDIDTGLPLRKDGKVTLYYPTTVENAKKIIREKKITPDDGVNKIFLTNESEGWKVAGGMKNMTQETDGSGVVLLAVDPRLLHIDQEFENGRKDFFIPVLEGQAFDKKMMSHARLKNLMLPVDKPIDPDFTYVQGMDAFRKALDDFKALDSKQKAEKLKESRKILKEQHNIKKFLTLNQKLAKTDKQTKDDLERLGVDVENDGVISLGLSLAPAQQLGANISACPKSAICKGVCLGDTANANKIHGGIAKDEETGIRNVDFRAAGRLQGYLKTEALLLNPEASILILNNEINNLRKRAKKENKTGAVRLNVLSDLPIAKYWRPIVEDNPDIEFYDYSKLLGQKSIPDLPNHNLVYSSSGVTQEVDGKVISHPDHNWGKIRNKLDNGDNIAMAFSHKSKIPEVVVDEETGREYKVFDGDVYDARFLDPKENVGLIIGLKNKDGDTTNQKAVEDSNGFFVAYDPKKDGNKATIPDQNKFKSDKVAGYPATKRQIMLKVERAVEDKPLYQIQIDPTIEQDIEDIIVRREPKAIAEKINDYVGVTPTGEGYFSDLFGQFRQEFINKYEGVERLSKKVAQTFGNSELLADQSAIAATLMSDRSAGVFAQTMREGIPVYKKGYVHVDTEQKSFLDVLRPLAQFDDPRMFEYFQAYAGYRRAKRLIKEGRERNITQEKIDRGIPYFESTYLDANGNSVFKQVYDDYQKFNTKLVDFMVDTGLVDKESGDKFKETYDYIPFYRQMQGDKTAGPQIFQSLTGISGPRRLKGGEEKLAPFFENSIRNIRSTIDAGMKNVATQRIVRDLKRLSSHGTVGKLIEPAADNTLDTPDVITVREKNKKGKVVNKKYRVADPLLVEAMRAMDAPQNNWFVEILSKPSQFLREMVTRDPAFIGASVLRESLSTWVTTGRSMTPLITTTKSFVGIATEMDPTYKKLINAGIGSGYDFKGDVGYTAETFEKEIQERAGRTSKINKALFPLSKAWDTLDKYSTAADLAPREAVYKEVLEKTGNEAEAVYQALEVINFSRKGRGALVRTLSAIIPFFNARIQGLDLLYRAGTGRIASEYAVQQQKKFLLRSLFILASTGVYWTLVRDTDEWKNASEEERDNYWLLPGVGNLKIPIPFEIGVMFKVLPERILETYFGDDSSKDLRDAMRRQIMGTLGFNPIPQAVLPLAEVYMNHSVFLGREIVGLGMKDLTPEAQYTESTSLVAKEAGSLLGISPMKLDYILRGYTGNIGTYFATMTDSVIRQEDDPQKATWRLDQIPVLKRFLTSDKGSGAIQEYYELRDEVRELTRTLNSYTEQGLVEKYKEYIKENGRLLAIKPQVLAMNRELTFLRRKKNQIAQSRMDPDSKRRAIDAIREAEQRIAQNTKYLRKIVDG